MSLNVQANTQFVKLVTHNSTDKIVERSQVKANEASIGHHLVSVKNSDNNLKINEMIKKIITEEDKSLKKYSSTITKNITTYEKKKQNIENEIVKLEAKISNGNSTKSHRSGIHNNIMSIKQEGNQQKLENLNNQLKAHNETLGKLRGEQQKTASYRENIEAYLSKSSPEMQNEFFANFSKSEINTSKIQSMFEDKLKPLLNKRDKYVAALNTLSDIQNGKPSEKKAVIPAAQSESSKPQDAGNNRKVSVADKAADTPAPQQQVNEPVSKGTTETIKSAIPKSPPMPTESTPAAASPAPAGSTIPAPPHMPKEENNSAASSPFSERKTTPTSPKDAQVEEVKQGVVNDKRTSLFSDIRNTGQKNLKPLVDTDKQPIVERGDTLEGVLRKAMQSRRPAFDPADQDEGDSGIDNSDDWDN